MEDAYRLLQEAPKPWSTEAVTALADLEYCHASTYFDYHQYAKAEEMLISYMHRSPSFRGKADENKKIAFILLNWRMAKVKVCGL